MRGLKWLCCILFGCMLMSAAAGAKAETQWYLRVIARDDTSEAQAEKLRVRDAVIAACPEEEMLLPASFDVIKKAAESAAPCRVEIKEWSPDESALPALTLYITVGEGRGHNVWGVLYADSLLMAKAGDIPEDPERVEFVWPIWRWLLGLFGL